MKKSIYLISMLTFLIFNVSGQIKSIQDYGVLPENSPEVNRANLQKAIDEASIKGGALYIEPVSTPYRINSGIILKNNVTLLGAQGPTPRGTVNPNKKEPVGSVFAIVDSENPFITVESATKIQGIQFWYPNQELKDSSKIIPYPPTIQASKTSSTQGVTLSELTFYGEYIAMDFNASRNNIVELILIKHCYGYPLSGQFIRIDYCYDIPRILHCHVNPAIMRKIGLHFSKDIIDAVVSNGTYAYSINHTDNAVLMDLFTFGTYGGIHLGKETYGQLTNFNLDCVKVGIYKDGSQNKNRNWQIAQGSIIANGGKNIDEIRPIIVTGRGHTSLTNVEAFSGDNGALTNIGESLNFLTVDGNEKLTISLIGCRMRNYQNDLPFSVNNPNAIIQAVACVDKNEEMFNEFIMRNN